MVYWGIPPNEIQLCWNLFSNFQLFSRFWAIFDAAIPPIATWLHVFLHFPQAGSPIIRPQRHKFSFFPCIMPPLQSVLSKEFATPRYYDRDLCAAFTFAKWLFSIPHFLLLFSWVEETMLRFLPFFLSPLFGGSLWGGLFRLWIFQPFHWYPFVVLLFCSSIPNFYRSTKPPSSTWGYPPIANFPISTKERLIRGRPTSFSSFCFMSKGPIFPRRLEWMLDFCWRVTVQLYVRFTWVVGQWLLLILRAPGPVWAGFSICVALLCSIVSLLECFPPVGTWSPCRRCISTPGSRPFLGEPVIPCRILSNFCVATRLFGWPSLATFSIARRCDEKWLILRAKQRLNVIARGMRRWVSKVSGKDGCVKSILTIFIGLFDLVACECRRVIEFWRVENHLIFYFSEPVSKWSHFFPQVQFQVILFLL